MNLYDLSFRPCRSVRLLLAITILCSVAGCSQRTQQPLAGVPNGDAEILSLSADDASEIESRQGSFRDLIEQPNKVVLVEFWGPNCGPCVHMIPVLERIVEKHPDTVSVVKVNLELASNRELGSYFEIYAIPQIRFFVDGKAAGSLSGFVNATQLTEELQPAFAMLK